LPERFGRGAVDYRKAAPARGHRRLRGEPVDSSEGRRLRLQIGDERMERVRLAFHGDLHVAARVSDPPSQAMTLREPVDEWAEPHSLDNSAHVQTKPDG